MLQIVSAHYRNFRALRDVTIPLRRKTVLVGPNNAGKTSVLQGLEHALGLGRRAYVFDERDVSEGVDPFEGFEIRVEFGPTEGDTFRADEVALFGNHVDVVDGRHRLFVVISGRQDDEEAVFRTRLRFSKSDGGDDGAVSATERAALSVLLLPAVREARHEFGERGGLWSRLGSDANLSPDDRHHLERLGLDVGSQIVTGILGAELTEDVGDAVTGLLSSVLYADEAEASIAYSSVPTDLAQALRSVEVRVAGPNEVIGRRIGDQSVGTQSVAMFGLFGAYARSTGASVVAVGVEEPEAHLHPHATRSIVRHLDDLGMQVIVTTHSTSVTDAADPRSIVRLRRRGMETTAHTVAAGALDDFEARTIQKMVCDIGSDFVFARAVLLAEGASERLAIPRFAQQLGHDFDVLGVTVVPVRSNAFGSFARLLGTDGLAIPFALVADRDAALKLLQTAKSEGLLPATLDVRDLGTAEPIAEAAGVFWWSVGDFEQCLFDAGAGPLYVDAIGELYGERYLTRFARNVAMVLPPDPGADYAFLRRVLRGKVSKPLLAQRVAEMFAERHMGVPAQITTVIEYTANLAREEVRLAVAAEAPAPTGE
jgi:putative ATP-dependent endonuclease of OLD family